MKKHWSMFLGVSLLAGVTGSIFFRKKKNILSDQNFSNLVELYKGSYWFIDRNKNIQHKLSIDEQLHICIDGKPIKGNFIEFSSQKLTIQDLYGYHLVIHSNENGPQTLYDEADDLTYSLSVD